MGACAPGGDPAVLERGFERVRSESSNGRSFSLRSVVQSKSHQLSLDGRTPLLHALVIDEFVSRASRLERDDRGLFTVVDSAAFIDTRWAYCWLPVTDHGLVLVDKGSNRQFALRVLSEALFGSEGHVMPARVDVEKVAREHPGHWLGAIERQGHWQRGTLYGDAIEQDSVVGPEYVASVKNQVGYTTQYFGPPRKVRVTRDGHVTILADFSNRMDWYVEYILDEVWPYVVAQSTQTRA